MTSERHTVISRLIELSRENRQLIAELERFRRHITVMFTDIRGSTAYFEKFGDVAGLIMVHECNRELQQITEEHGGHVHKTIGDAIMASFEDCKQSVQAAIAMQERLLLQNASKPREHKILVRIGLHYGTGIVKSNDVFGDVVNVASRVESVASPEQILISENLQEQVQNAGFTIIPVGRFQLKGKESDCGLSEVIWNQRLTPQPVLSHTVVSGSTAFAPKLKVEHLAPNGDVDVQYDLHERLTVGRTEGDILFAGDLALAPLNAAISVENGQVFVESLSQQGRLFLRLMSVHILKDRDVVMMGKQVLEFRENPDAIALGAAMGATLANMTTMLKAPVAQFVSLTADGSVGAVYNLTDEEVRFGRIEGTYTFPEDRLLSRSHTRVYQRGENLFLEDTGSRNGTFIKVRDKTPVPVGATILAGQQLLRVSEL
jgi:class 3 adenylate cyclase